MVLRNIKTTGQNGPIPVPPYRTYPRGLKSNKTLKYASITRWPSAPPSAFVFLLPSTLLLGELGVFPAEFLKGATASNSGGAKVVWSFEKFGNCFTNFLNHISWGIKHSINLLYQYEPLFNVGTFYLLHFLWTFCHICLLIIMSQLWI